MTPMRLLALPLLACLVLTACSSAPTFTVAEAYVAARTDEGTQVNIAIDARNDTGSPMPLWEMNYTVNLAGAIEHGRATRWAQTTIGAHSTMRFEVPVITRATGPSNLGISGSVEYIPSGRLRELLTEVSVPLPTTSFSGSTTVNLDEAPRPPARTPLRVFTATLIDSPPRPVVDSLPPIQKP